MSLFKRTLSTALLTLLTAVVCVAQVATPAPDAQFGTGWKPDPEAVKRVVAAQPPFIAKQIGSLAAAADNDDALVYRFLAKALNKAKIDPLDQKDLGSCVGFATAHATEIVAAADIVHRLEREEFKFRASGGGNYALSRTHSKQLGSWEGSSGAWAVEAMQQWGTLWQGVYASVDLSRYDIPTVRRWQERGVPNEIIEAAKLHPARGCALLKDVRELKAILQNGYTSLSCASQTFASRRDSMGFSRGTIPGWNHAMAIVAYRGPESGKEGFLVMNSWRPDWISGPEWPEDQPYGSFWADVQDMQKRLDQGDTWAVGGINGFPKREMEWLEALSVGGK